ncbi:cysteine--tRNA ligase [Ulvibacterium sp.]|uniref:cysteine--tRNA ligase n=1 Tax=Ulvibacterium sp. TaxID=2665914 RepID=UPI003CC53CAC
MNDRTVYIKNSLSGEKEPFVPLVKGKLGMYVCGPTVYGEPHLGHARSAITFDTVYRYFRFLGYQVRYVRNITDVGHLEDELNEQGEDKIAKKARIEQLEPMEVAQNYTNLYRDMMARLNVLPPSIEPTASGHILEQIDMIEQIMANGFAYERDGSVYFNVMDYAKKHHYGQLSGRVLEDLLAGRRALDGQDQKKHPADFALWKKAEAGHLMQWRSPWGMGFPGWHIECSAMSIKYLGLPFDIHGGGMDLKFPHHEAEIAQCHAAFGQAPVRYWMHNNMVTLDGQKMAKSKGNFISLGQMFSGDHPLLEKAYSPVTLRFVILQAHYGSTIDFSNQAIKAAEVACGKLLRGLQLIEGLQAKESEDVDNDLSAQIRGTCERCYENMDDDFNTAETIASLFELLRLAHKTMQDLGGVSTETLTILQNTYRGFLTDVLGIQDETKMSFQDELLPEVMDILIEVRQQARAQKDFAFSDYVRDRLATIGIQLNDDKEGATYATSRNL